MFGSHPSYKTIWIHCPSTLIATCLPPVIFRCSFRRLLSINALQTDGSSAVSVWLLTRFRRWIRGGIAVQVLAWVSSNFERCYSVLFRDFDVSKVPVSLPLYEVLLLTLLDIWWMDDGILWVHFLNPVQYTWSYPRKSVIGYWKRRLLFSINLSYNEQK